MNYTHLWQRGNIWIFDFFDKSVTNNYQTCLQLSGQGCREMELLLEHKGISWQTFLQNILYAYQDVRVKRLDIALDELYKGYGHDEEHIQIPKLIDKLYAKEIVLDTIRKWNITGGGSFTDNDDMEANHGLSLYFGSRQSQLYFNFYEKRYEIARMENISLEESLEIFGIWNRYELRFSDQKAQGVVEEYINGVDLGEIARGIVNKEIQVYDGVTRFGAYKPYEKWQELFGGVEPLKLSTSPQPYSIERTIRWLTYQVANSLALVSEADKIMQTEYMKMIQNSGEITDRGEAILRLLKNQQTLWTLERKSLMEYKVEINSLNNFKAWSGGLSTLNTVRERGGIDTLTTICEDLFSGNTPTDTQINDWLWFETDFIYQALGYEDLLEG